MINSGIYSGTISQVYPPSHEFNDSTGYQYIYEVIVATEKYAFMPVLCVRMDPAGSIFNFDDLILSVGQHVFIGFPFEDTSRAVILGSRRAYPDPQKEEGSIRWEKRFNSILESVSFDGVWKQGYTSDVIPVGPSQTLTKDNILIDDGGAAGDGKESQSILVDRVNNIIKINSGEWTLQAKKGVTINVTEGDVKVTCNNASIDAKEKASVKTKSGNVSVDAGGDVEVKAKKNATVKASKIMLNSNGVPLDGVITTATQPTCYVTGIPFKGSATVLAGK